MTAYRFVTLTCNGCGEIWDPGCAWTAAEARRSARVEMAWARRGHGEDLCAPCAGTHERVAGELLLVRTPRNAVTEAANAALGAIGQRDDED